MEAPHAMDALQISGKWYISSRRAAKEYGYHADYIGQLVRSGKVKGQKVGRSWYVLADSLVDYFGTEGSNQSAVAASAEIQEVAEEPPVSLERDPIPQPLAPSEAEAVIVVESPLAYAAEEMVGEEISEPQEERPSYAVKLTYLTEEDSAMPGSHAYEHSVPLSVVPPPREQTMEIPVPVPVAAAGVGKEAASASRLQRSRGRAARLSALLGVGILIVAVTAALSVLIPYVMSVTVP